MIQSVRHIHVRELRFLGAIALTLALIALHLGSSLRLAEFSGTGWRTLDLSALQRRIDSGELSEREASWYHRATPGETEIVVIGAEGGSEVPAPIIDECGSGREVRGPCEASILP